jgi:MoxR-like ATPase
MTAAPVTSTPRNADHIVAAREALDRLAAEMHKAIIGQEELVQGVLVGLLAGGNILLEGPPGVGKTLLVRVLSQALDLRFSRIQFTPDLMPADITGGAVLSRQEDGRAELRFRPGPIFAQVVLADEINRATPKTQAALLEAMQEHAVTVGGERRVLDEPFFVIATQNPLEMEGTYPLPEAQLDRFLLKLDVPYPPPDVLRAIGLETTSLGAPTITPVMDREILLSLQALARSLLVVPQVADLAARLTLATHPASPHAPPEVRRYVRHGASPRAMQALILASRARALLQGRAWVSEGDVRAVAPWILGHRMILDFDAALDAVTAPGLCAKILTASLAPAA